jgi:hypothetical protein
MPQETQVLTHHSALDSMLFNILPFRPLHAQGANLVGDATDAAKALLDDFTLEAIYHDLIDKCLYRLLQWCFHDHAPGRDLRTLVGSGDLQKVILLELSVEQEDDLAEDPLAAARNKVVENIIIQIASLV